jgi:hypothetical protein
MEELIIRLGQSCTKGAHQGARASRSHENKVWILDHPHGVFLIALITAASILKWNDVTSVSTAIGATTSLVGTVVGSFLGVQVGAAGKERVEADRNKSEETARIALSMLPPEVAIQVQEDVGSRGRPTS